MKWLPQSLFGRTAATIAITLSLSIVISVSASFYFVMVPMAKRTSDDFAAVIVSAAHSLQSLPEELHAELKQQLLEDHGLIVAAHTHSPKEASYDVPYSMFLREALARRAGEELRIIESETGPLIWVDVPAHGKFYRLGFDRERLGTNPPVALLLAITGGVLLTFLASLLEVRRVARPLHRLSVAVDELAQGKDPPPLNETGPTEIAALARAFNRMTTDLREMAENRTVMIAGISHDLRTPLTRLGIAVEMLDERSSPAIVAGIRRDLEAMNSLIGQFLQFSKGLEDGVPVQVDLWKSIESLAHDLKREGTELRLHRNNPPCVYFADRVALQRVLQNLLKNAVQYGAGKPIDVTLDCSAQGVSIKICDRGPGIPSGLVEKAFRPFHRLETARGNGMGGSGLGLAIARQLAVKHGWTIELLPRDGGGTVARVGLPTAYRFGLPVSCYASSGGTDETGSRGPESCVKEERATDTGIPAG
jgi:two-component system osmolarity sensor histidine kinase EnvZ